MAGWTVVPEKSATPSGWTPVNESNAAPQQTLDPNQEGMQAKDSAFYSDLLGMVKSLPEAALTQTNPLGTAYSTFKKAVADYHSIKDTGKTVFQNEDAARKADGRSLPYRALAPIAEGVGVNVQGMEQSAREGDQAAVLGHAAAAAAPVVAGELVGGMLKTPQGVRAVQSVKDAIPSIPSIPAVKDIVKPEGAQAKVMPTALNLPRLAREGVEDIFRAAAPTGKNVSFRDNAYAAAHDLADVARKMDLTEAKGGIVNPDMRVRATVQALSEHLDEMYKTERAPQIAAHADAVVDIPLGDATRGLEFIKRSGGTLADQALADKAIRMGKLTLSEADQLAMTANQYLKSFEGMTAPEKLEAISKTPKIGGLKALDMALGKNMNKVLTDAGEKGLRDYERRYAGVAAIRDQLSDRINAVELKRGLDFPGSELIKGAIKGKSGIASASQAAVADVNIGERLQAGFQKLNKSGVTAKASVPSR
jgi:hypothetical protein